MTWEMRKACFLSPPPPPLSLSLSLVFLFFVFVFCCCLFVCFLLLKVLVYFPQYPGCLRNGFPEKILKTEYFVGGQSLEFECRGERWGGGGVQGGAGGGGGVRRERGGRSALNQIRKQQKRFDCFD